MEKVQTMPVRLNKYLAESGISSRRKAEELILQGRVEINNQIVMDLAYKVDPENDVVIVDGEKIKQRRHLYFLLNKPRGFVTTTSDEKNRNTVVELINTSEKIFPVGRLDYNTTGVLLLTNDGDFTNLLTHPRNRVPRVYEALIDRMLTDEDKDKLLKAVYIEGRKGKFQEVKFIKPKDRKLVLVTATEGRNHFVKNMFGALGYTVLKLNRSSFAGIEADVPEGKYRKLSADEVNNLFRKYAIK